MALDTALLQSFVQHYSERLASGDAAIFAGAGLSVGAGFVDWRGLLREIATEVGLEIDRETDLVAVAQYHENKFRNRASLNRRIITAFARHAELSENHRLIARLPLRTIWTTNYDTLLEDACKDAGKICQPISTPDALPYSWPRRDVVLYKMHGDISDPSKAVVTKDDYEVYRSQRQEFLTVLTSDLLTKTFLFLGFSFTDPNLDYLLGWIRLHRGNNPADHYWITRRVDPKGDSAEDKAEYDYERRKQELRADDLNRYGIKTILVESYGEITGILSILAQQFRSRTVFVAGSAHEYGEMGVERVDALARSIGEELITRDYRLVTGFGLGIGGAVLLGAVGALYLNPEARLEDRVLLRPFPRGLSGQQKVEVHRKLRHELLEQAGFAIFLAGNRFVDGVVSNARGVYEEFEVATNSHRAFPIPVGATGYMARQIWEEVSADPVRYYGEELAPRVTGHLAVLGDATATNEVLVKTVFRMLEELRSRHT